MFPEDTSVMGGGYWTDNGDGTWSVPADYTYYSYAAYELYLMGMMAPEEVPDWFYLNNTNPPQPRSYWANPGATVTGDYHLVTMQMLLDAMGTRDPVYPNEKRDLFVPMVLVVRPGQEPSAADWEFMMSVRDPWRDAFHTQTHYRGTVTTLVPHRCAWRRTASTCDCTSRMRGSASRCGTTCTRVRSAGRSTTGRRWVAA